MEANRVLKRSRGMCVLVDSLKPKSLKHYRIIHNTVGLMKTLEKQALFCRCAHHEHKARIEKAYVSG